MGLISSYKKTLKPKGIEEYIDLIFYRPLGYILAIFFRYTPFVNPNMITGISAIVGITSGFFIAYGHVVIGVTLINIAVILDCADGQLARMTNHHSVIGRALDGFVDYLCFVSLFLGITFYYINLGFPPLEVFEISATAGVSLAIQAASLDYYRNNYLSKIASTDDLDKEIHGIKKLHKESSKSMKVILGLYLIYMNKQKSSFKNNKLSLSIDQIKRRRIYGTSMHIFLISICFLFSKIEIYLITSIIIFNGYLLILAIQKK